MFTIIPKSLRYAEDDFGLFILGSRMFIHYLVSSCFEEGVTIIGDFIGYPGCRSFDHPIDALNIDSLAD